MIQKNVSSNLIIYPNHQEIIMNYNDYCQELINIVNDMLCCRLSEVAARCSQKVRSAPYDMQETVEELAREGKLSLIKYVTPGRIKTRIILFPKGTEVVCD